jgi:uncharacterized delta-60 repeat protein
MSSRQASSRVGQGASALGVVALAAWVCLCVPDRALADRGSFVARFNIGNGGLDPTFGFLGITLSNPVGDNYGTAISMAPLSSKILQAGTFPHPPFAAGLLGRTHFNGGADTSFGWLGVSLFDFAMDVSEEPKVIGFQSSLRIVVAGTLEFFRGFVVARYLSNGALDTTFGANGFAAAFPGDADLHDMAIDSNNRIVLAGSANDTITLVRLTPDGAGDNTFGQGGVVQVSFGGPPGESALAVEIVAGDKIMVAVNASNAASRMGVMRFTSTGQVDTTFGSSGKRLIDFPGTVNEQGFAIDCSSLGCMVAGGSNFMGGGGFTLARVLHSGSVDQSFGLRTLFFPASTDARAVDVAILSDQSIVLAGTAVVGPTAQPQVAVARYASNGSLVPSFGTGGFRLLGIGPNGCRTTDMAIDAVNGKILVTGMTL